MKNFLIDYLFLVVVLGGYFIFFLRIIWQDLVTDKYNRLKNFRMWLCVFLFLSSLYYAYAEDDKKFLLLFLTMVIVGNDWDIAITKKLKKILNIR